MGMVPQRSILSFQPGPAGSEVGVGGPSSPEASGAVEALRPPPSGPWDYTLLSGISSSVKRVPSLLPNNDDELPPLLITTGEDGAGGQICVCFCAVCLKMFSFFHLTNSSHVCFECCQNSLEFS